MATRRPGKPHSMQGQAGPFAGCPPRSRSAASDGWLLTTESGLSVRYGKPPQLRGFSMSRASHRVERRRGRLRRDPRRRLRGAAATRSPDRRADPRGARRRAAHRQRRRGHRQLRARRPRRRRGRALGRDARAATAPSSAVRRRAGRGAAVRRSRVRRRAGGTDLHHWGDWRTGCAELRRVARRCVVLTWDPAATATFWLVAEYVPRLLDTDRRRFPATLADQIQALGADRAETVAVPHDCTDGFLGAHWRAPERYLAPQSARVDGAQRLSAPRCGNAAAARRRPPPGHAAGRREARGGFGPRP